MHKTLNVERSVALLSIWLTVQLMVGPFSLEHSFKRCFADVSPSVKSTQTLKIMVRILWYLALWYHKTAPLEINCIWRLTFTDSLCSMSINKYWLIFKIVSRFERQNITWEVTKIIFFIYTIPTTLNVINTLVGFLRFTRNKHLSMQIAFIFHLVLAYHILTAIYQLCLFVNAHICLYVYIFLSPAGGASVV